MADGLVWREEEMRGEFHVAVDASLVEVLGSMKPLEDGDSIVVSVVDFSVGLPSRRVDLLVLECSSVEDESHLRRIVSRTHACFLVYRRRSELERVVEWLERCERQLKAAYLGCARRGRKNLLLGWEDLAAHLRRVVVGRLRHHLCRELKNLLESLSLGAASGGDLLDSFIDALVGMTASDCGAVVYCADGDRGGCICAFRGMDTEVPMALARSLLEVFERLDGPAFYHEMDSIPVVHAPTSVDNWFYLPLRWLDSTLGGVILGKKNVSPVDAEIFEIVGMVTPVLAMMLQNLIPGGTSGLEGMSGSLEEKFIQMEKMSSLGQLAAGITHEINNPLTSIIGFSELLRRKLPDDESVGFIEKVLGNASRIQKILRELKEFYVPARHRLEPVDVNALVENTISIVSVHPEAEGVEVRLELEPDLPPVVCEDNNILQVLVNLLINAYQAMGGPGGLVWLRTYYLPRLEAVEIEIQDNGCGISQDNMSRIFDPFFTTKADWKGTGLGLSVSYTIVSNHRGKIEVSSKEGRGAVFSVYLLEKGPTGGDLSSIPVVSRAATRIRQLLVLAPSGLDGVVSEEVVEYFSPAVSVFAGPDELRRMSCSLPGALLISAPDSMEREDEEFLRRRVDATVKVSPGWRTDKGDPVDRGPFFERDGDGVFVTDAPLERSVLKRVLYRL